MNNALKLDKTVFDIARSCTKRACNLVGADHLWEDAHSEMLILLYNGLLAKIDPDSIQPYLNEVGRRIALAMRRRYDHHLNTSLHDEEGNVLHDIASDDFVGNMDVKIDAQAALERIKRATAGKSIKIDTEPSQGIRQQYKCGDLQIAAELRFERKKMNLTQKQMAGIFGLKLATYIAYEQSCVISPNDRVVQKLRELQQSRRG